jgi:hypothetical protein
LLFSLFLSFISCFFLTFFLHAFFLSFLADFFLYLFLPSFLLTYFLSSILSVSHSSLLPCLANLLQSQADRMMLSRQHVTAHIPVSARRWGALWTALLTYRWHWQTALTGT